MLLTMALLHVVIIGVNPSAVTLFQMVLPQASACRQTCTRFANEIAICIESFPQVCTHCACKAPQPVLIAGCEADLYYGEYHRLIEHNADLVR